MISPKKAAEWTCYIVVGAMITFVIFGLFYIFGWRDQWAFWAAAFLSIHVTNNLKP